MFKMYLKPKPFLVGNLRQSHEVFNIVCVSTGEIYPLFSLVTIVGSDSEGKFKILEKKKRKKFWI